MKVAKFGGTSLASSSQIKKVCDIITSDKERKIVVVSAPGKRFKEDTKVTDLLINCAKVFMDSGNAQIEFDKIIMRFSEIGRELSVEDKVIDEIKNDIYKRMISYRNNKESYMDLMKAAGEDNTAKLVAGYLTTIGFKSAYVNPKDAGMILSSEFGNARILEESYEKLSTLKDQEGIVIFPGFFGYSKDDEVVTFSRGGSDITGSILAAATNADCYENFTDVDCIYTVNPSLISCPVAIREITYREMRELAYAGFSVFHEEALLPVYKKGIPVRVLNTNNPCAPGTTIVAKRSSTDHAVIGIASDDRFCCINISKYLMNREIGFGRKVLEIIEKEGLSYDHSPSGIDHISIVLNQAQFTSEKEVRIIDKIKRTLGVEDVLVMKDLALIMVVGEGMSNTVGIASRAAGAIARANVNIEMINQGLSEISIMFCVKAEDSDPAVISLYEEFFVV